MGCGVIQSAYSALVFDVGTPSHTASLSQPSMASLSELVTVKIAEE